MLPESEEMDTILVRYCEIGLKSDPVRRRFEHRLQQNMVNMLVADSVEAVVRRGNARFYVETEDADVAIASLKKVFGIASLSVAEVTSPRLEDIRKVAAELSVDAITEGNTFAVRSRHDDGNQSYTSMDINRAVGQAILDKNVGRGISVNLSDPDTTIYIEVRCGKAYIFTSYLDCHGGLPLGSQGTVVAEVHDDRGVVSAWLMMKRGCRVAVRGDYGADVLRRYDPGLKVLSSDMSDPGRSLGRVLGISVDELDNVDMSGIPKFFPTIGMSDSTVNQLLKEITAE